MRSASSKRVIVIGGGVAGMTVAHELALAGGFDVTVYELRETPGGKARSVLGSTGDPARLSPVPGEHGFRFFPAFYRHLPDTMGKIPYPDRWDGVRGNLVHASVGEIARAGGRTELISPSDPSPGPAQWLWAIQHFVDFGRQVGVPPRECLAFARVLGQLMVACDERWFGEYERRSWWDLVGAERRSAAFQRFFAEGLTRSLVAARAREISARSGGAILLQLLKAPSGAARHADRLLNGPTNMVWIDPWLDELRRHGVRYELCHRVEAVTSHDGAVTGVVGHRVHWRDGRPEPGPPFADEADFYVCAVPVEVVTHQLDLGELRTSCPGLARLGELTTRWMNGIQFYLREDVPIVNGHTIYIDSPWALTSVSQAQFWPQVGLAQFGDGRIGGIISVDISDWETPGAHGADGKVARVCTRDEVAREVWMQMQDALNDETVVLDDANLLGWFLDPDIVAPNPSAATRAAINLEPLLINTANSYARRPEVVLPEVPNLLLASDYVRTFTDLATMEAANEAGRRAVIAILDAAGSAAPRPQIWPLQPAGGRLFRLLRAIDAVVYRAIGSRRPPHRRSRREGRPCS